MSFKIKKVVKMKNIPVCDFCDKEITDYEGPYARGDRGTFVTINSPEQTAKNGFITFDFHDKCVLQMYRHLKVKF